MTDRQRRIRPELREKARELRRPQTPAEQVLWASLQDRRLDGLKFRRQHPIGPFIADFYCAECHLVIEIDGDVHSDQVEYDGARSEWLNERGYTVLRFTNQEVQHQMRAVLEEIWTCARGSASAQSEGEDLKG